jgi:hypothetical protein
LAIIAKEGSSKLGVLLGLPFLFNMLQATGGGLILNGSLTSLWLRLFWVVCLHEFWFLPFVFFFCFFG